MSGKGERGGVSAWLPCHLLHDALVDVAVLERGGLGIEASLEPRAELAIEFQPGQPRRRLCRRLRTGDSAHFSELPTRISPQQAVKLTPHHWAPAVTHRHRNVAPQCRTTMALRLLGKASQQPLDLDLLHRCRSGQSLRAGASSKPSGPGERGWPAVPRPKNVREGAAPLPAAPHSYLAALHMH